MSYVINKGHTKNYPLKAGYFKLSKMVNFLLDTYFSLEVEKRETANTFCCLYCYPKVKVLILCVNQ